MYCVRRKLYPTSIFFSIYKKKKKKKIKLMSFEYIAFIRIDVDTLHKLFVELRKKLKYKIKCQIHKTRKIN